MDYFSKWVKAKAKRVDDAKIAINFLKTQIFVKFGFPKVVISDHGTHFYNKIVEALFKKYHVTHRMSTAYHHKLVERKKFLTEKSNPF